MAPTGNFMKVYEYKVDKKAIKYFPSQTIKQRKYLSAETGPAKEHKSLTPSQSYVSL
jgi:hypothetical protein